MGLDYCVTPTEYGYTGRKKRDVRRKPYQVLKKDRFVPLWTAADSRDTHIGPAAGDETNKALQTTGLSSPDRLNHTRSHSKQNKLNSRSDENLPTALAFHKSAYTTICRPSCVLLLVQLSPSPHSKKRPRLSRKTGPHAHPSPRGGRPSLPLLFHSAYFIRVYE